MTILLGSKYVSFVVMPKKNRFLIVVTVKVHILYRLTMTDLCVQYGKLMVSGVCKMAFRELCYSV